MIVSSAMITAATIIIITIIFIFIFIISDVICGNSSSSSSNILRIHSISWYVMYYSCICWGCMCSIRAKIIPVVIVL